MEIVGTKRLEIGRWKGEEKEEQRRSSPPWLDSVAAKNRSSVRRWFIAKDRWLARRNKELRAFHDGLLANTVSRYAQNFRNRLTSPRAHQIRIEVARIQEEEAGRGRERGGSRPRMHTRARVGRSSNSRNFI